MTSRTPSGTVSADVAAGAGQPGGLADVERVAVGARHDGVDDLGGELGGGDPAYQLGGVGVVQAGEVEPQRLVPGQGGQRGRERLGDLRRAVGAEHEQRRVGELGEDVDEQRERLVVGAVQVVEDDEQRAARRGLAEPGADRAVQPEPLGGGVALEQRRVVVEQRRQRRLRSRRAGRAPPGSTGRAAGRPRPRGSGPTRRPSRPARRRPPRPASTCRRRARRTPAPPAAPRPRPARRPARAPPARRPGRRTPSTGRRGGRGRSRLGRGAVGRGGRARRARSAVARWGAWSRMSASSCRTAGARVDAELVGQPPAQVAQRGERVGLPPALVERERQQPPRTLPQRVRGGVRLQVVHRLDRRAEGEGRLGRVLDGDPVQLLEAGDLGRGPLLVGVPAVGAAAPQGERLGQPGRGRAPGRSAAPGSAARTSASKCHASTCSSGSRRA